ncbi:queuosine precursor transporter [Candidatus Fermentibacteria bacterium]|nr:queuosine precursor transporter [Candidatus Fermentibacteria bacterium]
MGAKTHEGGSVSRSGAASASLVSACYIAAQMLSDIASLRIVIVAGFSMDAGTLVYPVTFTLRDLLHKVAGKTTARAMIAAAAVVNVVMAALFWLVSRLPADMTVGPQHEFGAVLSPVWRIVAASIVAEVLSELLDTEVYSAWTAWMGGRMQWTRVLASNAAAVPVDSLVFCWLAFGGVLPAATVWGIVIANLLLKGVVTLVSVPAIYLVGEGGRPRDRTVS